MDLDTLLTPSKLKRALKEMFAPAPADDMPLPLAMAKALTDIDRFSELLRIQEIGDDGLVVVDLHKTFGVGFMLQYSPLLIAGTDAEPQIEAAIAACPAGSIVQFSVHSGTFIHGQLDAWALARIEKCKSPLLREMCLKRREFLEAAADGNVSLLGNTRYHPRGIRYYVTVMVPFEGDTSSALELATHYKVVTDLRETVQGALDSGGLSTRQLTAHDIEVLMRELLNPQIPARERLDPIKRGMGMIERNTRIRVDDQSRIVFSSNEDREIAVTCITADAFPAEAYLPATAGLLGDPMSREDRITPAYWAYTTITVLDQDATQERLGTKLAALTKQTMTESGWMQAMMGDMRKDRAELDGMVTSLRNGHSAVRVYSGINLYSEPVMSKRDSEYACSLWRKSGFRASPETILGLPAFLASLPFHYNASMDPPNRGLNRATTVQSLNAASLVMAQGDWGGNDPRKGGPILISRRGQVATLNLLETTTNYNFIIVAASGSGKSFFANEIISDFLSRDGLVRIIDVGRSYSRFCHQVGGQELIFDPRNPVSLNPFTGVTTKEDLAEMLPILKAMLRQMAFPLQAEQDTPAWEYQALEAAIQASWDRYGETAELKHVYDWLLDYDDTRGADLAFQLAPFATGRYAAWFSGERQLSFNNDMIVIELEELKNDPEMQAVVLTLCINQITKEMYLSDRAKPKLLAVDEAWDLLGNVKTGKFIETAFRRARKYGGIAGVITQSFEDFERSPAAKAAIENAAWQFVLYQKPESLAFAEANKRIISDEYRMNLLKTVQSGPGYSEVYVRSEQGEGIYRFVVDRHSYWTFTTNPKDVPRLDALVKAGVPLTEAIDQLARADYANDTSNNWMPAAN